MCSSDLTEKQTSFEDATHYNNYYEFGTDKADPAQNAHTLRTRPWTVQIDGEVKKPMTIDIDRLTKLAPLEERVYRLRCVEGWSMVIPWVGYSLSAILKKVQPTFITVLSSFSQPIVIIPAEHKDDQSMQLRTVGTGPWQLQEFVPGSFVRLKRYADYKPNTKFEQRTGFGGYKQACLDTVTFRIVTEPGARVAGLKTGELQGVEDLPTKSLPDLKKDTNITILPLAN